MQLLQLRLISGHRMEDVLEAAVFEIVETDVEIGEIRQLLDALRDNVETFPAKRVVLEQEGLKLFVVLQQYPQLMTGLVGQLVPGEVQLLQAAVLERLAELTEGLVTHVAVA